MEIVSVNVGNRADEHTEDIVPRHKGNGSPKIYPPDFDPAPVQAWIDGGCKGDPPKGGKFYTRTTTFIDALDDKSSIEKWKTRKALQGVLQAIPFGGDAMTNEFYNFPEKDTDWDSRETKQALDALAERARKAAGTSNRADIGTAIHEVTEAYDNGEEIGFLPPEFEDDVNAYIDATKGMEMVGVEQFVVNDDMCYAGTADRLIRVKGGLADSLGVPDGAVVIGDLKTGSSVDYSRGKYGMQLAAYAYGKVYDPYTLKRSPLKYGRNVARKDKGILIHLPAGEGICKVYGVDLTRGWKDVKLALAVRQYRSHHNSKAGEFDLLREVG